MSYPCAESTCVKRKPVSEYFQVGLLLDSLANRFCCNLYQGRTETCVRSGQVIVWRSGQANNLAPIQKDVPSDFSA